MNIGILGSGQLAKMLVTAGIGLDHNFMLLSPDQHVCEVAPLDQTIWDPQAQVEHIVAHYDDIEALNKLAHWADVITYESESIPVSTVNKLAESTQTFPSVNALAVASDRLTEKTFFRDAGITTAAYAETNSKDQLKAALQTIGYPAILKTRRDGYDGKGQITINSQKDIDTAWDTIGNKPCILEAKVPFDRELSIIGVRSASGNVVFYSISENWHREGILRLSLSLTNASLQKKAETLLKTVLSQLDYVGVLTLELFEIEGQLIVNEMAPRVHNSGHWTLEATQASQFHNHICAITGAQLGNTSNLSPSAMINLIGSTPAQQNRSSIAGGNFYIYGKTEKPNRKLGHIGISSEDLSQLEFFNSIKQALELVNEASVLQDFCQKKS